MQKLFKVFDEGFEIMDMLRAKQGLPSVPRLPGYMPHVWVGDYQVQFHVRDVNGNARKVVRRYKTQKQAEAAVKAFEEEGFTIEAPGGQKVQARTQRDIGGDFFDSIAETLERFDHDSFIDKKIRERIQKSEYNSFKSFLGSEIERVPGDVGGYLNEMGRYATDRFADGKMAREMAARIREIPVRYTQAIADFYKDTLLRSEVLKPIQEAEARGMFKYTPNLLDYAKKRIHRNLEKDYLSELGVAVEKALSKLPAIEVGNTRTTVRDVIKGLTTWTYWSKLFVKPAYAVTNVLQPVLGIARVMAFEAEALVRGAPGGNVAGFLKTLSRLDKVYKNFAVDDFASVANFDRYVNEGLAYLEASGRLETISATHEMRAKHKMELQPAGIRGKIQSSVETFHKRIENAGRRITAAAFIEYYRKMYPNNPKAAYDAAARAMSQTMGEFSEGSVAAIYAHAGTVSELARPFTNLKHMYLGNVVNSVKLMAEAKKTHGALSKEMAASAGALLGGQLVIGTLAGVGGLVLYQEAKALYELINRWLFNGQGGDFDEAVRDHLPSGLVGEIVTYGVPAVLAGQATGGEKPPLGQMMGMPQMNQLPLPVPPAGQTAWDIIRALWTTGKAAAGQAGIGTPVPGRDVAQAVSRIAPKAPFLTGRLETQFGDVSQGPYGGQVRRTEDQQAVLDLWGQKASSETEEQQRVFGLRQARRGQADVLEDSAASIVDGLLGAQNRDPGQIYVMLIEKGYSSREIEGAIKREISRQEFSAAEGITKGASSGDWARRVRLMDLMSRFKVGPYDTTSTE